MKNRIYALVAFAISAMYFEVAAESYPAKPIRMIVPFAAASSTDLVARLVANELSKSLTPIVVENRPGANGIIGADLLAKAVPDGYTIMLGTSGTHGVNSATVSKLPYDPIKDFEPISLAGGLAYVLMANNNLPASSVGELVSLARANPGKYSLAVSASTMQLIAELFKASAKIDIILVPYKSQSSAYIDLANGDAALMIYTISASVPHIKAGRAKAIAVSSPKRSTLMLETPSFSESGYPEVEAVSWVGFFAPANTPKEIISKLHDEIVRALRKPEIMDTMLRNGMETIASSPEQLADAVKAEIKKWTQVVKEANIPKLN